VTGIHPWLGRPQRVRAFNALVGGVGVASRTRGGRPTLASSEAESRTRVYVALERGGVWPEGCWGRLLAGPLALSGPWSRDT
jgi:hypothetical protein